MRQARMLVLSPYDVRAHPTGGAKRILSLASSMAQRGPVTLAMPTYPAPLPEPLAGTENLDIIVGTFRSRAAQAFDPTLFRRIVRRMRGAPPNVIVGSSYPTFGSAFVLARLLGAALVLDDHNVEALRLERIGRPVLGGIVGVVERSCLRGADLVTAVSDSDAESLRSRYRLGRLPLVVPNGYSARHLRFDAEERSATRRRLGVGDDEMLLAFVGDAAYRPNGVAIDVLQTKVLPALQRLGESPTLLLVGNRKRLGAGPQVIEAGTVPDVRPYLNAADCLAAPLRSGGGTKLKILEALAMGLPVVTTPVGAEGLDDCLTLANFRVVETDEAFPGAITQARRLGRGPPPQWFAAKYSWEAIGSRLWERLASLGTTTPAQIT